MLNSAAPKSAATAKQSSHRVALVSGGILLGGSTTFLVNFAGELLRRNIPTEVFSFERENPMSADFEKQKIPLTCLDQRRMIFEDRMEIVLQKLARFQPTVVVTTLGATSFEVLRYLPKGIFRVAMAQSHDLGVYGLLKHYTPWMDSMVVVSAAMKQTVEAIPEFSRVPVLNLPYGVPICSDAELPRRDFKQPLRILYLGRLEQEQKRVRLFPEILRQLRESGMPFHWTIAGEGSERSFLEANLKSDSPEQSISFAGPVRYAEVPALLKQHDIYLLASDYEGLPLSLLEAMGCGVVPVVSDLESGIREVVDKTIGVPVPVNDVSGYARGIIHLNQHRDELAAKSAAARARVQQEFSAAAMTDRWLAIFPSTPSNIEPWPEHRRIRGVLNARNPLHFSWPMRMMRRAAARMRS
jgi:glycosyltransferase involved in cell wall biosynthesis